MRRAVCRHRQSEAEFLARARPAARRRARGLFLRHPGDHPDMRGLTVSVCVGDRGQIACHQPGRSGFGPFDGGARLTEERTQLRSSSFRSRPGSPAPGGFILIRVPADRRRVTWSRPLPCPAAETPLAAGLLFGIPTGNPPNLPTSRRSIRRASPVFPMGTGGPPAFIAFEKPGRGRMEAVTGPNPPAVPAMLAPWSKPLTEHGCFWQRASLG